MRLLFTLLNQFSTWLTLFRGGWPTSAGFHDLLPWHWMCYPSHRPYASVRGSSAKLSLLLVNRDTLATGIYSACSSVLRIGSEIGCFEAGRMNGGWSSVFCNYF